MGWGSGSGKSEVINAAVSDPVICGSGGDHPFDGKLVFIDVSGLAHKASKKDAMTVVREGTSAGSLLPAADRSLRKHRLSDSAVPLQRPCLRQVVQGSHLSMPGAFLAGPVVKVLGAPLIKIGHLLLSD